MTLTRVTNERVYKPRRFEQLYSSPSDREKKQTKTIYNRHQNTIDMQDYQAVTRVQLTK